MTAKLLDLVTKMSETGVEDERETVFAALDTVARSAGNPDAPLDDLLRVVGDAMCAVLGVRRYSIYLRRDDGLFQGRVGWVAPAPPVEVREIVTGRPRDRFAREIVRTRTPVFTPDASSDPRLTSRPESRQFGARALVGIPLVVDATVIGIIYADDEGRDRGLTRARLETAEVFAAVVAAGVQQLMLVQRLHLDRLRAERQRDLLLALNRMGTALTAAVTQDAGADELLEICERFVQRPLNFYDPGLQLIAGSPSAAHLPSLSPRHLAEASVADELRALRDGAKCVDVLVDGRRRRFCAVSVGQEVVGYLEVGDVSQALAIGDEALTQLAAALALVVKRESAGESLADRASEHFISDVLYGRADRAALHGAAPAAGVDPGLPHLVLRIEYQEATGTLSRSSESARRRRTLGSALNGAWGGSARCVGDFGVTSSDLLLVELASPSDRLTPEFCATTREALESFAADYDMRVAVLSDAIANLGAMKDATDACRETASLVRRYGREFRLVCTKDFGLLRLLSKWDGMQAAQQFGDELFARLAGPSAGEAGLDATLFDTIEAFVTTGASVSAAARTLGVHENTVRYRLDRIERLSGLRLDDAATLTEVMLALQVRRLLGQSEGPTDGGRLEVSPRPADGFSR